MVQNGQNDHFGQSEWPYSEPDFGIHETEMDHFGPFWPKVVYCGPFRSANRTLAMPEFLFKSCVDFPDNPYPLN